MMMIIITVRIILISRQDDNDTLGVDDDDADSKIGRHDDNESLIGC